MGPGSSSVPAQAVVPLEVAEAVGGFSSLTPFGTSVLLQGELTKTPEGTKQACPCYASCDLWCLR